MAFTKCLQHLHYGCIISTALRKENAICLYALKYAKIVRAMKITARRLLCLHPKGKTTQRTMLTNDYPKLGSLQLISY